MTTIILSLLAKLWPFIAAGFGGLAVLIAARRSGAAKERAKQNEARLEAMTEAARIDEAVAGNDPDANRKEMGKWAR